MSDRSIILVYLVLVTITISSLVRTSECSRYLSDDVAKSPRHRHRHRHDAMSVASSRRNHEAMSSPRRSPWPQQEDDYDDALDVEEEDEEEDEDYDIEPRTRTLYPRSYQPSRNTQRNHHARFENRYPLRYHQTGHHQNPWYRGNAVEDSERRRNARYGGVAGGRGHRQRPGRDRTHHEDRRRGEPTSVGSYPSRNHEFDELDEAPSDEEIDQDGYDRNPRRWRFEEELDENSQDYRGSGSSRWRNSRRYRPDHYDVAPDSKGAHRGRESRRNDWKPRTSNSQGSSGVSTGQRTEDDDWNDRRRKIASGNRKRPGRTFPFDDPDYDDDDDDRNESRGTWSNKKSRNNLVDRVTNTGVDRRKDNDLDDRDYDEDTMDNADVRKAGKRREEEEENEEEEAEEEDDEEDSIWKDDEENDDADDEDDQDFDNTNYYKSEDEPPYKTFDDIIKSLTSDDPTTPKTTVRREYRNTGIEKFLRRDAYGNIYDSRNVTSKKSVHDTYSGRPPNWTNKDASKWRVQQGKPDVSSNPNSRDNKRLSNAIGDSWRANREQERRRLRAKLEEPLPKTKSLEQEYDEDYDNEKDENVSKLAGEHVTEMQADVTNTDYADEENETETEGETSAPVATSPRTTTTTSTTTTTTTTTTARPVVVTTPPRVTQERRDSRSYGTSVAPQSNGLQQHQTVHGSHKWQSLTTRDGDSKGQLNKYGKAADIRDASGKKEALQHAMKVSREGSCQWPRARVIPVREVYPSPSTTYIPHCAILHRCSDDTGCCRSEALTCMPKISHRVELYFYTNNVEGTSVVEKLSFYNHTECECRERAEYTATSDKTGVTNEHRHHPTAVSPPQNIRRPPQRKPCKCPSEFTPRITHEGVCQCNCYENDQNCIRTRRGKGYFSLRDRLCIQTDECASPMCEFGDYMRRQGKCPRKKDIFDTLAKHNLHHSRFSKS